MSRKPSVATSILCATVLLLASNARAQSEPARAQSSGPDSVLRTATFFSGGLARTGTFPGKLVCLSCDVNPSTAAKTQCEKSGHRHALAIDGDPLLHPLLVTDETILARVNSNELHGSDVIVTGVYYPAVGAILVSGVERKS
jgi:hypothetical protein